MWVGDIRSAAAPPLQQLHPTRAIRSRDSASPVVANLRNITPIHGATSLNTTAPPTRHLPENSHGADVDFGIRRRYFILVCQSARARREMPDGFV
ncbi:hypothetical protein EVAR_40671_1 [Eumeta japonica]|uniref:Uncharacterized protein n=1 Tax=Eumeta variegata TaxID=151549 RepID=A0A4C1X316_EUMVA|nr:hypothetical protein EVAR_40671_1 [Eumeta japonica]